MSRPSTCSRRQPVSSSAAALNTSRAPSGPATTIASGAASISASVLARRSARSMVSLVCRICAATIAASARVVARQLASQCDASPTSAIEQSRRPPVSGELAISRLTPAPAGGGGPGTSVAWK